jgi:hypothetical protein
VNDSTLLQLRDELNGFASQLHLEEQDLPEVFDAGLLETSQAISDLVTELFSANLARRGVAFRLASRLLVEEPSPDSMSEVLAEFGTLAADAVREIRRTPTGARWRLARHYSEICDHLASPAPAENQSFRDLPGMLAGSPWLKAEFARLAKPAKLDPTRSVFSRGFGRSTGQRYGRSAGRTAHGQLGNTLEHLLRGIETRARQVWHLRRSDGEDRSLNWFYAQAHADMFPDFRQHPDENRLALEVAKLKGLALGLQLPEFALCYESSDWMAHYALSYLLPPAPDRWPVHQACHLERVLRSRLTRWYFQPFDHDLEPLEVTATVLRMGRPLFYERVAAHALLEYSLLQGVAFQRSAAPFYMEAVAMLEREFCQLFDGYLLRLLYYPKLKAPQGWCDYLAALYGLHFGGTPSEELEAFRFSFLSRRGLKSAVEILYRIAGSHGAPN